MTTTIISTTVTKSVTLGAGGYGSTLTITGIGVIAPAGYGVDGIIAPASLSGVSIVNDGTISAAGGTIAAAGGIGVDILAAGGILLNNNDIVGGAGGVGVEAGANNGGVGVRLSSGDSVVNHGTIAGGAGGFEGNVGGHGGAGAAAIDAVAGASVANYGTIEGGNAAFGYNAGAAGGRGISFASTGTLLNRGVITGGYGARQGQRNADKYNAGAGGNAVAIASTGVVTNSGKISGGAGGAGEGSGSSGGVGGIGVSMQGGTLSNTGTIAGGAGGAARPGEFGEPKATGAGGAGVDLTATGTVSNSGLIAGGAGGASSYAASAYGTGLGGVGIELGSGATLVNRGTILAGAGGNAAYARPFGGPVLASVAGAGGTGVLVGQGAGFTNAATVTGGAGGYVQDSASTAGAGGAGVNITATAGSFSNAGTITGGAGGAAYNVTGAPAGIGATGGNGVDLSGGTLTNTKIIAGGAGGYGQIRGGAGGAAVRITGGTLVTSGTLIGGAGGVGNQTMGATGDAVQFGATAATLEIDPTAVFKGLVVANASVNDVLELAGTSAGTLAGLGSTFTNFSSVVETSGANWTLARLNVLAAGSTLQDAGRLSVTGTLSDAGAVTISGNGDIIAGSAAGIEIGGGLTLAGGTLSAASSAAIAIGTPLLNAYRGDIVVGTSSLLSGFGTIAGGPVLDNGEVLATGGTLALLDGLSGSSNGEEVVSIASGATLVVDATLSAVVTFSAAGGAHLVLGELPGDSVAMDAFGSGDSIDLRGIVANALSFGDGVLSLFDGATAVGTLAFFGDYTSANFALTADGHGGTDIDFVASAGKAGAPPDFANNVVPAGETPPTALRQGAFWHDIEQMSHAEDLWRSLHW
jgi:hypothetical protein